MGELNKVVVHMQGGRILKGTTQDFFPSRPLFHLRPVGGGDAAELTCADLKAVYFVKDFHGKPDRRDVRGFLSAPGETAQGRKLAVCFKDGELLCGYSLSYTAGREGFFVFPADSGSNNMRIFVVTAAAAEIQAGPAAEALARKLIGGTRAA